MTGFMKTADMHSDLEHEKSNNSDDLSNSREYNLNGSPFI